MFDSNYYYNENEFNSFNIQFKQDYSSVLQNEPISSTPSRKYFIIYYYCLYFILKNFKLFR
jgi:hypothetical protein